MKTKLYAIKWLLLCIFLSGISGTVSFGQQVAKTIPSPNAVNGIIGFLEFRPSDYGSQKHPLIIFMHGIGERGDGTSQINNVTANGIPNLCSRGATMRFTVNGQTSSFVVLSPQLNSYYGSWPSFYAEEMIKYAKANLSIDTNRIYVTGLSLGGGGAWTYAYTSYANANQIAALAPVCGTDDGNDPNACNSAGAANLPIWAFHCEDDGTVTYNSTVHQLYVLNCAALTTRPRFTFYKSGGHSGAWNNAYDTGHITRAVDSNILKASAPASVNYTANPNLYEWFLMNSRAPSTGNTPPTVSAGSNQTIQLPTNSATLSGSASGTNGATISSYAWTQVSGPNTAGFSPAGTAGTSATGLIAGTYVFKLTATDNNGLSNNATVTVTVNAATPPTVSAGSNQTIQLPATSATLTGTASGVNGATISSYAWTQSSGPSTAGFSAAGSNATMVTGLVTQGTYTFKLTVTDSYGSTNSATVQVKVNPANTPPTVSAGSDQTIQLPTTSATLTGSASGTNGATISSYAWTQSSGPSTAGFSAAGSSSTNATGLVAGAYVFTLTVTDNHGLTNSATVSVTVSPAYTQPTVSAGSDQTIQLPTNSASLSGTASGTNGATISSYAWTQSSGPSTAGFSSAGSSSTNATGLIAGTYVFTLTVTDNHGLTNSAAVSVTVNPANTPPTVSAGSNQTITLPASSASLSGSASGTNGATISSYAWTQSSGPSTAGFASAGSAASLVTGLVQGTYVFTLTVTDNHGLSNSANVTVIVNPPNTAPTVSAGSDQTIQLPTNSATLSGSASGTNGATISSYSWTQNSGPSTAGFSAAGSISSDVTGLVQGTYVFTLTVTDNNGLSSSASVTVTVNPANTAPAVNAGSDQTIQLPTSSASLAGTASGTNGATISSYAWTQASGPSTAGFSAAGSSSTDATGLIAGTYVFTLTVTDNHGLTNSASVTITVTPANTVPTVNAGSDQTIQLPTSSASLAGTASGTNGATISSYAWTQSSGPSTAGFGSAGSPATTATGLTEGTYVFTLTVTDNHGLTNSASVTITVLAANTPPAVSAGSSQTITLPTNSVALGGSASGTNGATISTYAWTQTSGPSTATLGSAGSASATAGDLVQGTYVFTLTVVDNHGLSASATVTVIVNPKPNDPPVANAGNDTAITLPVSTVMPDGSASYDPDGSIVRYSWNKISGPGAITILYSNTTRPTVIGLQAGVYVFELTVTDDKGASATDQVQITVNPSNNKAPLADAGHDTTVALPYSGAILNGMGSRDPDGKIASYVWSQVSGPTIATIAYPLDSLSAVTGLEEGQYRFLLTVTDNEGYSDTASMTVTVVNNFRYSQYFRIYPNPVVSTMNLEYIDDKTGKIRMTVFDESGRLVLQQELTKDQSLLTKQIDLGALKQGMYYLQLEQAGATKLIRPFVKQ